MVTTIEQPAARPHTIWGLDPDQLHARYWASRGVQVVRQGEPSEIVRHAELYLLTDRRTLVLFKLGSLVEQMSWVGAEAMFVRLTDARDHGYREVALTDADGRLKGFKRLYGSWDSRFARVALTTDREIAQVWQSSPDARTGWKRLRAVVHRSVRWSGRAKGRVYDGSLPKESAAFVRDLVKTWHRPDSTVNKLRSGAAGVWAHATASVGAHARCSGPIWVGAGRTLGDQASAVGPAVMWDDPGARPPTEAIRWLDLEASTPPAEPKVRAQRPLARAAKRAFDIAFALAALAATLPLYPFIMLAIYLEDGAPFFFAHTRETIGGREFPCVKFRSMRKDAEKIKAQLQAQNKADGPQFFMEKDPRLTRTGALLRKVQLDEIPQFYNVLVGHMSIVGPRPSPFAENQFCPAWREARLSVRPGVTGLWQIKRTRAEGADFQEWIKYDIEYVEKQSFAFDLYIIWRTIVTVLRGVIRA